MSLSRIQGRVKAWEDAFDGSTGQSRGWWHWHWIIVIIDQHARPGRPV